MHFTFNDFVIMLSLCVDVMFLFVNNYCCCDAIYKTKFYRSNFHLFVLIFIVISYSVKFSTAWLQYIIIINTIIIVIIANHFELI